MNSPEQQLEFAKLTLLNGLRTASDNLKQAAGSLDQFALEMSRVSFAGPAGLAMLQAFPQQHAAPAPTGRGRRAAQPADGDEQPKKRKRIVKPKDPNAPSAPASSYLIFQNAVRQQMKTDNPNLPNNELLALISSRWASMTEQEKQQYDDAMKQSKERYAVAKAAYDATKVGPDGATASSPVIAAAPPPKAIVPIPVAATSTSEESSEEEDSDEEEESDEEEAPAPAKKSKKSSDHPPAKPKKVKS